MSQAVSAHDDERKESCLTEHSFFNLHDQLLRFLCKPIVPEVEDVKMLETSYTVIKGTHIGWSKDDGWVIGHLCWDGSLISLTVNEYTYCCWRCIPMDPQVKSWGILTPEELTKIEGHHQACTDVPSTLVQSALTEANTRIMKAWTLTSFIEEAMAAGVQISLNE